VGERSYYNRFPGDYLRDTGHLSLAEHGAYNLLLDAYYSKGKPLPPSVDALVRIVGAQGKAEREAVEAVAEEFFKLADDGFRHNTRADRELQLRAEFIADQSRKGRLSAEAKRQQRFNSGSTAAQPKPQPNVNPPSPSPSPYPEPHPQPPPERVPAHARARQSLEPSIWSGEVLTIDRLTHERFLRLYDEKFLLEQYPQIDVKLAGIATPDDPWTALRVVSYATTWLSKASADNGHGKVSAAQRDKYAHLEEKA
jgi:uncharacterized protein YdaU (DUF1376 family)